VRAVRQPDTSSLTEREAEVYDLIVNDGLDNTEIADALGRSVRVAKFHVGNILRKCGAPDRLKLVVDYWRGRSGTGSSKRRSASADSKAKGRGRAQAKRSRRR
jgi:DNA-binding CsgD family transcriptional regulator